MLGSHRRTRRRALANMTTARGMTPSETLLVLVVIAALALIVAYGFRSSPGLQGRGITISRVETVMAGLESYAVDNGATFPTTEQGLKALVERPSQEPVPHRWNGPYVDETALRDAWATPLHYVCPGGDGRVYDLWSNGADKAEGGEGEDADIQSWSRPSMCP